MTPYEEIRLTAAALPVGQSINGLMCPFCGRYDDKQLSITRDDTGLLFICFRAGCNQRGRIGDYSRPEITTAPRAHVAAYDGPVYMPQADDRQFMLDRFGLDARSVDDYVRTGALARWLFPVYARAGDHIGYVLRKWPFGKKGTGAKTINYVRADFPRLAWYNAYSSLKPVIVIVEDCVSALVVRQAFPARAPVALLGSSISDQGVADICAAEPSRVIIALDPGAEKAAIEVGTALRPWIKDIVVRWLPADVKDLKVDGARAAL